MSQNIVAYFDSAELAEAAICDMRLTCPGSVVVNSGQKTGIMCVRVSDRDAAAARTTVRRHGGRSVSDAPSGGYNAFNL